MKELSSLYENPEIRGLIGRVEGFQLARDLNAEPEHLSVNTTTQLQVAAALSFAQMVSTETITSIIRKSGDQVFESEEALNVFLKWDAYLNLLIELNKVPAVDDLVFFASSGLFARRHVEVRFLLRRSNTRSILNSLAKAANEMIWPDRVRATIGLAIVSLVRQEDHEDILNARQLIQTLSESQKQIEAQWLEQETEPSADAFTLMGHYHLAQAIIRLSEFLLVGSVQKGTRVVRDFASELGRLLTKAEDFFSIAGDLELLMWLKASAWILLSLRADSIWVTAIGISERIDSLVQELVRQGRERPVFSLLPSQRDALRQRLLDRTQVAVVLQMPTSTGKTLLAEFAIAQAFEAYKGKARVVYLSPTRALATQIRKILSEDLRPIGIEVSAAGSAFEEDPYELNLLQMSDGVIVATPEKLDLMLRAHTEWFDTLRLVVVDEAHLLKDSERGIRLELLLANLRREQPQTRLLLLTPFVDNATDIAKWLGGQSGTAIEVHWRPAEIVLGMAKVIGRKNHRMFNVEWNNPFDGDIPLPATQLSTTVSDSDTTSDKIVFLASHFQRLGTTLAMFSASPTQAEKVAEKMAATREPLHSRQLNASLRLAIALAKDDYGNDSSLATCMEKGVAFHHSSLSPMLRYLIEDQIRTGTLSFVAATSTIAQGMNFPVATVLVHSVHKPNNKGNWSPSEFWNIAGRAGRVGLVERGMVVFADSKHRKHLDYYCSALSERIVSALLAFLQKSQAAASLKELYRLNPELRPFLQYLAHAASKLSPGEAMEDLEELLQASLAGLQVSINESAKLRMIARSYLQEISGKRLDYLKAADTTGLGSFSFDRLYAAVKSEPLLGAGPSEILRQGEKGFYSLVDVLRWLPELGLALGMGHGEMNVQAVARVVQRWLNGEPVYKLANEFPGNTSADKIRHAGKYLYGTVSQTISWGAHAYLKGWMIANPSKVREEDAEGVMLPAYIQYGVNTPEATVVSLLGLPREFAEPFAEEYRERHGKLVPQNVNSLKDFIFDADEDRWARVVSRRSSTTSVNHSDLRMVWRQMQGLA